MPTVPVPTVQDVIDAALANLNDTQQSIWTDARIMLHVRSAVNWLATKIATVSTQYFTKVQGQPYSSDIAYTAGDVDLTSVMPADLYEPEVLEWRLGTGDQWQQMDRVARLPTQMSSNPGVMTQWEWSGRTLRVNPSTTDCLLRLRYLSLVPSVNEDGDSIPIDNCVQALGFATAAFAYGSRGQTSQAILMWGSESDAGKVPSSGARMYAGQLLDIIVKNEQLLPRRGAKFSTDDYGYPYGWPTP